MVKNFVCPQCGRRVKTKQGLEDHQRSHQMGAVSKPKRRKVKKQKAAFSVAGTGVPSVSAGDIVVYGEDRVRSYVVRKTGASYQYIQLDGTVAPRLHTMCRAYQRMEWLETCFYVSAQAPLTTLGGYVAGFVADPDDGSVTLEQLSATRGAVTKKWYETAEVSGQFPRQEFYTSGGIEPRMTSPGRFWVIKDGQPSQDLTVVVTLRWRVKFSQAFYGETDRTFFSPGKLVAKASNWNLQYKFCDEALTDDCTGFFGGQLPKAALSFFRVPTFSVEYKEGVGDTGSVQMHFIVFKLDDKRMYYSQDGATIDQTSWQDGLAVQTLVPTGTLIRYAGTGNGDCPLKAGPQSSLCQGTGNSLTSSADLCRLLKRLLDRLEIGESRSTSDCANLTEEWEKLPDATD